MAVAKASRRTQAERRATTRAALLDATIDCLVEEGYGATTTNRIVERAGLSRGAQVHHFPTKSELVAEAVGHLARRRADEFFDEASRIEVRGRRRFELMLDHLWRIHASPLFTASVELWVAARADPDVGARLAEVERDVEETIAARLAELFPDLWARRAFRDSVDTSLAAMRGLALLGFVDGYAAVERRWPAVRRRLLASIDELIEV